MPTPHAPTVNPEHHLNNPEQIRTNLNKPEHRQTPRPDREPPESPQKHPEKTKPPNTPYSVIPACAFPVIPAQAGTAPRPI